MYKKNSESLYRKTQIYSKPLSGNTEIVDKSERPTIVPPKTTTKAPKVSDFVKAKKVSKISKVEDARMHTVTMRLSHQDLDIGEGDVRVAAWVASRQPYTIANALIVGDTDQRGVLSFQHNCKRNTEILIRARAANVYVGPTHDLLYVSTGADDTIDITMRRH
jgi:hypothetical protein